MKKVDGKIIYPDDSQPKYVNCAFGGINGNEILVNLAYEYNGLPVSFEVAMLDEHTVIQNFTPPAAEKVKKVEASLVMSRESAQSIYEWLGALLKAEESNESN